MNPVWYFDATGSMMKPLDGQGRILLYTFVCHNSFNRNIVPLSQFFTTSHDTLSISRFLLTIKTKFLMCAKTDSFSIAPVIVTDESWAGINALCDVFNGKTLAQYIIWSYEVIVEHPDNLQLRLMMRSKFFLCHVHFLYNAIKKVKILNLKNETKDIFVYGFIALQNSTTIHEFNEIYKCLHIILNQEFCAKKILHEKISYIRNSRHGNDLTFMDKTFEETHEKKSKLFEDINSIYFAEDFHGEK